jgi:hypothetical protein
LDFGFWIADWPNAINPRLILSILSSSIKFFSVLSTTRYPRNIDQCDCGPGNYLDAQNLLLAFLFLAIALCF